MAGDFDAYFWRGEGGQIAAEWLLTWGEVRRGEKLQLEPLERGSSRVLKPGNLTIDRCMALDVEVTLGTASVLYLVLWHRYVRDLPLATLNTPGDTGKVLEACGFVRPVTYWRIIHEAFGRRLVTERGLLSKPTVKLAGERQVLRRQLALGVA